MNSGIDFVAVNAFAKVAETGSFRGAAKLLAAPVSSVSVQVRRLEERLGTRLVHRTTRRVSLTDEGQRYFEQVRSALGAMEEAERSFGGPDARPRGRLRIGAPVDFGQAVLPKVLERFIAQHPEVDVELELRADAIDPIRDGFDVVLKTEVPESSSLTARKIGGARGFDLVASPSYVARAGTGEAAPMPKHPRDLSRHACLVMGSRQAPATWRFVRGRTQLAIVHRYATANDWSVVRDLALAGCGIARLPHYLAAPALAEATLVSLLPAYSSPSEQMYAVYATGPHVPGRVTRFVAELKAFLDEWPGCLARR